jgi:hypothetical protein
MLPLRTRIVIVFVGVAIMSSFLIWVQSLLSPKASLLFLVIVAAIALILDALMGRK